MSRRQTRYADYWEDCLRAHSLRTTRACHYAATVVGASGGLVALLTRNVWILLGGIAAGYAIAVSSHFLVQGNRPLIHRPVWGAVSDLRMIGLAVTGRLRGELARRGLGGAG